MSDIRIDLALANKFRTLFSEDFESLVAKKFEENSSEIITQVTLDFTDVKFIDVVTLLNISSFLQTFLEKKSNIIKIKLPLNPNVLSFLKVWDFNDSFYFATNKERRLYDCVEEINQDQFKLFFSDSHINYNPKCFKDQNLNELLEGLITSHNPYQSLDYPEVFKNYDREKNFFGVYSFDVVKNLGEENIKINKQIVLSEKRRWQQTNQIESILDNVLKDREGNSCKGYIPNKVIWECFSNALRHPEGNLIQTSSRFINKNSSPYLRSSYFILSFWDNGESMIETLKKAYKETKNIKAILPDRVHYPTFEVKTDDNKSQPVDTKILPGDYFYKNSSFDYYWLLSTFFPGVTRDPNPKGDFLNESTKDTMYKYPGMGLYLLLKTVIDTFDGSIIVRTGNYLMKIIRSEKTNFNYKAEINKVKSFSINGFKGNLLSISIPIAEQEPI